MKRTFTEAIKKQIAAAQRWTCSGCDAVLESTYQVDHTVPLWAGGEDTRANATAMCAGCHARKTQNEAIARSKRDAEERARTRRAFERRVRSEEETKRATKMRGNGAIECTACSACYYPVFPHACREVRRRIAARLGGASNAGPPAPRDSRPAHRLFEEYAYVNKL